MSTTCPHCGIDIQTDNELQLEIVEDVDNVVAIPVETLEAWQIEIKMLNEMITDGKAHTDRSKRLTVIALGMLELALETD